MGNWFGRGPRDGEASKEKEQEEVTRDTENADDAVGVPLTQDDERALEQSLPKEPEATPMTVGDQQVRFLHWNVQQGWTTNSKNNYELIASWCAKMQPDVISFNEMIHYQDPTHDMIKIIADKLTAKTGKTWTYKWVQKGGGTGGEGEAVMSSFPFVSTSQKLLSYTRSVAQGAIVVNGRTINVLSTHLDASSDNPTPRLTEIAELQPWAGTFAEQRVIMGDFNCTRGSKPYASMATKYRDSWMQALAVKTATAYPDNPDGNTRRARIDFIWKSLGATLLMIKSAQVYDTRDAAGVRPSDHNPLVVTFVVS